MTEQPRISRHPAQALRVQRDAAGVPVSCEPSRRAPVPEQTLRDVTRTPRPSPSSRLTQAELLVASSALTLPSTTRPSTLGRLIKALSAGARAALATWRAS